MLDRPERGDITLSPGLDRRNLSLNGFVAYWRVNVLGAFFQALQEIVGCYLAVARLCKEQKMLRMLVAGACLAPCVYRKLDSAILVMQPAKQRMRCDTSDPLNRARERRVLLQRSVRSHIVVIAGIGTT